MSQTMELLMDVYGDYATAINLTLDLLPWEDIGRMLQVLQQARAQQRAIYILGSGTHAATAAHMAAALEREASPPDAIGPRYQVWPLINPAQPLPIWDDSTGCHSLVLRLNGRLHPEDITIAIAGDKAPPEILHAVEYAKAYGSHTIGLLGDRHDRLAEIVDLPVIVPNDSVDQIEDIHQILVHIVARTLRKLFKAPGIRPAGEWGCRQGTPGSGMPLGLT